MKKRPPPPLFPSRCTHSLLPPFQILKSLPIGQTMCIQCAFPYLPLILSIGCRKFALFSFTLFTIICKGFPISCFQYGFILNQREKIHKCTSLSLLQPPPFQLQQQHSVWTNGLSRDLHAGKQLGITHPDTYIKL